MDDVIVFNALEKEDIHSIIDIELAKLLERISDLGYTLNLTDKAKDYIADKGFDKQGICINRKCEGAARPAGRIRLSDGDASGAHASAG